MKSGMEGLDFRLGFLHVYVRVYNYVRDICPSCLVGFVIFFWLGFAFNNSLLCSQFSLD